MLIRPVDVWSILSGSSNFLKYLEKGEKGIGLVGSAQIVAAKTKNMRISQGNLNSTTQVQFYLIFST